MKMVKFELNGKELEFVCESRNTRNGFAHDATLFVDGRNFGTAHCYYLNRTWESWGYQTVCLEACSDVIARDTEWLRDDYKRENNISRIAGEKRKAAVAAIIDNDATISLMKAAKQVLMDRSF